MIRPSLPRSLHEDSSFRWDDLSPELKMQIIMDITKIQKTLSIKNDSVNLIEYQARCLVYIKLCENEVEDVLKVINPTKASGPDLINLDC
jgi:hypothetical protein